MKAVSLRYRHEGRAIGRQGQLGDRGRARLGQQSAMAAILQVKEVNPPVLAGKEHALA